MSARTRLPALALGLLMLAQPITAVAQYSFDWVIADSGAVDQLNSTTTFHTDIINTGSIADRYRVTLTADMPATWLTTMCDAGLCYPPFITTLEFNVAPGDTLYVGINITPMIDSGAGTSTVTVASINAPAQTSTAGFSVLTPGADVLVVDADGVAGVPLPVVEAVAAAGRTTAVWDRAASGKLAPAELASFAAIVWHAGDSPSGLDADDRATLVTHLAGGGRLLLGGANLAFASCDPAGARYDAAAVTWYATTLGVGYAADSSGTPLVSGVPGDPVGAGLSFSINGNGANAVPDVLTAQGGSASLRYAGGAVAAVRRQGADGKSLFLGFDAAGIADNAARSAFMAAALDWLADDASAVPLPGASTPLGLGAFPNPFNPRTTLWVTNDGPDAAVAALDVYDLRGRHVRTLRRGPLAAGRTAVTWDGRDDAGRTLPTGPYLARLSLPGGTIASLKLTIAK
jgi:hypothetical protein